MSDEGLKIYRANVKGGSNREDAINKIKDYGIDVSLFVIFGGRADTLNGFNRTIDLADRLGVSIHPSLLVPYPGTQLYEEYKPFLIKDKGWEFYTGSYAVFEHPDLAMTLEAREQRFYEVSLELLSLRRIFKHLIDIPISGFPTSHMASIMSQLPVRHGMKRAYEKWKSNKGK